MKGLNEGTLFRLNQGGTTERANAFVPGMQANGRKAFLFACQVGQLEEG